jgi:hypothetical protein
MTEPIIPRYKLILFYDMATNDMDAYFQFVMNEMIPTAHEMGLYIFRAFHTIPGPMGGNHRMRQVEYVAEDLETVQRVVNSDTWQDLETKLLRYTTNYSRKVVEFRLGFQM